MLGWLEMRDEDQPPEHIWLDPEAITAHFEAVSERYKSGTAPDQPVESEMQENELLKGLRR